MLSGTNYPSWEVVLVLISFPTFPTGYANLCPVFQFAFPFSTRLTTTKLRDEPTMRWPAVSSTRSFFRTRVPMIVYLCVCVCVYACVRMSLCVSVGACIRTFARCWCSCNDLYLPTSARVRVPRRCSEKAINEKMGKKRGQKEEE